MKKILAICFLLAVFFVLAIQAHAKDGPNVEAWEPLQVIVTDAMPNVVVINGSADAIDPEFRLFYGSIERDQSGTLFTPGHDIRVQPFD